MEFIEKHHRDPFEARVIDQHTGKNTLRDDLNAGLGGYLRLEAHTIPDRLAHPLMQQIRHAFGDLLGGQTARFQHQDLSFAREVEQDGQRQ